MAYNFVIGLAGPYAAGCSSLSEEIQGSLINWPGCHVEEIHVATLIEEYYPIIFGKPLEIPDDRSKRRIALQEAGTELRKKDLHFIGKAIAVEIYKRGLELEKNNNLHDIGTLFFIVDSIKNVNDIRELKRIYSDEFYLLFLHANKQLRWRRLKDYKSWLEAERIAFEKCDDIDSDEKAYHPDVGDAGQQVRKLASFADYYIVNDLNREKLKIRRSKISSYAFGRWFYSAYNSRTFYAFSILNI